MTFTEFLDAVWLQVGCFDTKDREGVIFYLRVDFMRQMLNQKPEDSLSYSCFTDFATRRTVFGFPVFEVDNPDHPDFIVVKKL